MRAGRDGFYVYVRAALYSARNLTNGKVPTEALEFLARDADAIALRLVDLGLWDQVEGGYYIVDFLKTNPTADEVEARRMARAEAGRLGGLRSGESRRSNTEASSKGSADANAEANASAGAEPNVKQNRTPYPVPVPVRNPAPDPKRRAARAATATDGSLAGDKAVDEAFTIEMIERFGADLGGEEAVRDSITTALENARKKGYHDQRAAVRNWLRKDVEWRRPQGRPNGNGRPIVPERHATEDAELVALDHYR
jgi:hypothetical protein